MKITAYNLHGSAPFSRALVALHAQLYRVQGADAVMKSNRRTLACEESASLRGPQLDSLYLLINDPDLINDLATRRSVVIPSEHCAFCNATRDLLFAP
jgi:hypothetical protein